LFAQYNEFREADTMLQERILTYSEEARLEGIKEGVKEGIGEGKREMAKELLANGVPPDIIAKSAGLPLDQIKGLMN
jgi:predicted transposase/invertase (TIGR01784 family)